MTIENMLKVFFDNNCCCEKIQTVVGASGCYENWLQGQLFLHFHAIDKEGEFKVNYNLKHNGKNKFVDFYYKGNTFTEIGEIKIFTKDTLGKYFWNGTPSNTKYYASQQQNYKFTDNDIKNIEDAKLKNCLLSDFIFLHKYDGLIENVKPNKYLLVVFVDKECSVKTSFQAAHACQFGDLVWSIKKNLVEIKLFRI